MTPHIGDYPCPKCGKTGHSYIGNEMPSEENDYTLTINCECGHTFSIEFELVKLDDD